MVRTESILHVGHWSQRYTIAVQGWLRKHGFFNYIGVQWLWRLAYFFYKANLEDPYSRLIQEHPGLFQHGHILDIGANIGFNAMVFAKALSPDCHVYAFEPESENYSQLQSLAQHKAYRQKIVAVQHAIGDHEGKVQLWINPTDSSDHRLFTPSLRMIPESLQSVMMTTIDCFVKTLPQPSPIAFIKLDIQGYEGQALIGMSQTLQDNPYAAVGLEYCRPIIESLGFRPEDILQYFSQRHYRLFSLTRQQGLLPLTFDGVDRLAGKRGYLNLLFLNPAAHRPTDSIRL